MEITIEKKDSTNANIKVNLSESDYQPKVVEKLKEYSKKAQLKGFRPGKVPSALIQKMYGKSVLVDEINQLLSQTLNNYIKENNLPIIGDPLPDNKKSVTIDWENQKNFEFNYNVGLIPDFQYEFSNQLKITDYEIEVTEEVENETLSNLKNQFGKNISVGVVEANDTVTGKLSQGESVQVVTLILAKANKDLVETFTSKKISDTVSFELDKLFDDKAVLAYALGVSMDEVEDRKGVVEFLVEGITRTEEATLDQDFFDKVFGKDIVKNEQEFHEKLKTTIAENYMRESEFLLKRDLQETLVNSTQMELPNEFLKRWLLVTNQGKISEEQIEKEYSFYEKELKWNLIKNKLAKDNEIKVENADVVDKAKGMIRQQFGGMDFGPEMEETFNNIADNYLKQDKGKNYLKLYDEVLLENIITLAKSKINLEKKKITVDEFKTLAAASV